MRASVFACLALSACATSGVRPLKSLDLPTASYLEGAEAEAISGSLTFENGCLTFRAKGGERLMPIWPLGSVFNGTSLTFHRPGKADQALLIDEEIRIGGERLPDGYTRVHFADNLQRCGGIPFFVAAVRPAD